MPFLQSNLLGNKPSAKLQQTTTFLVEHLTDPHTCRFTWDTCSGLDVASFVAIVPTLLHTIPHSFLSVDPASGLSIAGQKGVLRKRLSVSLSLYVVPSRDVVGERVRTEERKTRTGESTGESGHPSHTAWALAAGCEPVAPALGSRQVQAPAVGIGSATSGLYLLICKMGTMPQPYLCNRTVPIWITKNGDFQSWKQFSIPILFKAMEIYLYSTITYKYLKSVYFN